MKKINKLIAGVASAAMIVAAFSACGSASSSGKKLDFITGMATGSVHLKTLQSITDEFEKANPGVEINLIPASHSGFHQRYQGASSREERAGSVEHPRLVP